MGDQDRKENEVIQEKEELQEMLWRELLDLLADLANLVPREQMDLLVCLVRQAWLV